MCRVGGSRRSVGASLRGGNDETPLLTRPDRSGRLAAILSVVRPQDPLAWYMRRGAYIFLAIMLAMCATLVLS